jgi:predicted Zn finger-like uncharacterized protein
MGFLDMKAEIGDLGWEAVGASDSTVMILTCPECATSYFVDDSRIAATGRVVKCSNCGARWNALPGGAEAPAAAAPAAPTAAQPQKAAPASPVLDELVVEGPDADEAPPPLPPRPAAVRREANAKVMILGASAAVVAVLIGGAIVFRAQVVQLLPATQAAYAGLGMPVSSLEIEKVHGEPAFQGGRPVLSVTGQVRNLRDAAASSPPLRVSLLDRFGKAVAVKVAQPIDTAVPARAVRYFAISIVDPPASVHDLEVSFEHGAKGATAPISAPAASGAGGPQPVDAKPLPPGSPDALPPHP